MNIAQKIRPAVVEQIKADILDGMPRKAVHQKHKHHKGVSLKAVQAIADNTPSRVHQAAFDVRIMDANKVMRSLYWIGTQDGDKAARWMVAEVTKQVLLYEVYPGLSEIEYEKLWSDFDPREIAKFQKQVTQACRDEAARHNKTAKLFERVTFKVVKARMYQKDDPVSQNETFYDETRSERVMQDVVDSVERDYSEDARGFKSSDPLEYKYNKALPLFRDELALAVLRQDVAMGGYRGFKAAMKLATMQKQDNLTAQSIMNHRKKPGVTYNFRKPATA